MPHRLPTKQASRLLNAKVPPPPYPVPRRLSTTTPPYPLASKLRSALTARQLPLIHDYLTPTPSHLLSLTLSALPTPSPSPFTSPTFPLPSISTTRPLPPGHHLAYFPSHIPSSALLPDGTDTLHHPGPPYTHRLWAGGSVRLNRSKRLVLNGSRAVCHETIRDVRVTGEGASPSPSPSPSDKPGGEKVFVDIERRYALCPEDEDEATTRARLAAFDSPGSSAVRRRAVDEDDDDALIRARRAVDIDEDEEEEDSVAITERRELVFLRGDRPLRMGRASRPIRAPRPPTFTRTLVPTPAMLFRFSALTFNAHDIHLCPGGGGGGGGEDGGKLLVHGPLTLCLLLDLVEERLRKMDRVEDIVGIEYRNLKPLFGGESMRLCGREREGSFEVWIEDGEGGVAVRGNVETN